MQFKTIRSIENDYDIYLKSEKLVHSNQEHTKKVSQPFGIGKKWFLAISSLAKTVAAIWREKKVGPCYLETKKCSSQVLGARKNIMTCIIVRKTFSQQLRSRKKVFPAIWNWKKLVPRYFDPDKRCCSYLEGEKSGFLLFGD